MDNDEEYPLRFSEQDFCDKFDPNQDVSIQAIQDDGLDTSQIMVDAYNARKDDIKLFTIEQIKDAFNSLQNRLIMDDNSVDIQLLVQQLQDTETSRRGFEDIFKLGVDHGYDYLKNKIEQSRRQPNKLVPAERDMIKYVNQYYTKIQDDNVVIRCDFGKTATENQPLLEDLGIPFEARHVVSKQRLTHENFKKNLSACQYTKDGNSTEIAKIWLKQPAGKLNAIFVPYGIKRPDNEADFFNEFPGLQAVLDLQREPHEYDRHYRDGARQDYQRSPHIPMRRS